MVEIDLGRFYRYDSFSGEHKPQLKIDVIVEYDGRKSTIIVKPVGQRPIFEDNISQRTFSVEKDDLDMGETPATSIDILCALGERFEDEMRPDHNLFEYFSRTSIDIVTALWDRIGEEFVWEKRTKPNQYGAKASDYNQVELQIGTEDGETIQSITLDSVVNGVKVHLKYDTRKGKIVEDSVEAPCGDKDTYEHQEEELYSIAIRRGLPAFVDRLLDGVRDEEGGVEYDGNVLELVEHIENMVASACKMCGRTDREKDDFLDHAFGPAKKYLRHIYEVAEEPVGADSI